MYAADTVLPVICAVLFTFAVPLSAFGQGVFVEAGASGQGFLRARGNECFVVTPFHVVERATGTITVIGEQASRRTAELLRQLPGDLAILRVNEPSTMRCEEWAAPTSLASVLNSQTGGQLSIREADGSRTLVPVTFRAIDAESITVRPSQAGDQIHQGMSGASLLVNGTMAGLLLSVSNGDGLVYQLDDIMRVSQAFFEPEAGSDPFVGCWQYSNGLPLNVRTDGSMTLGQLAGRWSGGGAARKPYTLSWPEVIDRAVLSPDGRTLQETSPWFSIAAARASGASDITGKWQWPNGVVLNIRPDGTFSAGTIAGSWKPATPAERAFVLTWPRLTHTGSLTPDNQRLNGADQYGNPFSAVKADVCSAR